MVILLYHTLGSKRVETGASRSYRVEGTYDENAQLDKYCYSGETYFIVIGKHNPALSSGNITLVIYKTL